MTFSWKPRGIGTSARFRKPQMAPLKIHMEPVKRATFWSPMLIFRAKNTLQRDKSAISGICVNIGICHPLVMAMHENQASIHASPLRTGSWAYINDIYIKMI